MYCRSIMLCFVLFFIQALLVEYILQQCIDGVPFFFVKRCQPAEGWRAYIPRDFIFSLFLGPMLWARCVSSAINPLPA